MKLVEIALAILVISWGIKLALFVYKGGKATLDSILWNCVWTGRFPSTHTAVLGGVIYTIWHEEGFSFLFGFSVIVSVIFVYTLLENRKRYLLLKSYYLKSQDVTIKSIVLDGKLDEFEGHTMSEVNAGFILGVAVAALVGIYV